MPPFQSSVLALHNCQVELLFVTLDKREGYSPHFPLSPEVELGGKCQLLFGGDVSQGHVRPLVIVCPEPAGREFRDLLDGIKQVLPQPVVTRSPVITLDIDVLLRLAGLKVTA